MMVKVRAYPMTMSNWGVMSYASWSEPPSRQPASILVEIDPELVWYAREWRDARHHLHYTTARGVVRIKKCEQAPEIQRMFPKRIERTATDADMRAAAAFDWSGLE
jgi:hypothetical protein